MTEHIIQLQMFNLTDEEAADLTDALARTMDAMRATGELSLSVVGAVMMRRVDAPESIH